MKEIKFRGKTVEYDKHPSVWVFGNFIKNHVTGATLINSPNGTFTVQEKTVGQLIGFINEGENELYEGDILEETYRTNYCGKSIENKRLILLTAEVLGHGGFSLLNIITECYPAYHVTGYNSVYSIAGNIHDNPELLNDK